jgi:hypothetical protein
LPVDRLAPFQRAVLEAFAARSSSFFVTGGAALAGYWLGHRETNDLDLFTVDERMDDGDRALDEVCRALGAVVEKTQTTPDFRRRVVRRGGDAVVVDLVRDRVPQLVSDKPEVRGVRVDPPE